MPRPRHLLNRLKPGRRCVVAGLAALYLVAAGGLPVPKPGKPGGVPFPCSGRACGCGTAEACWAGACCCFSAREKLAWADARAFTPPAHFLRAVEREVAEAADECPACAAKKTCCSKPAAPAFSLVVLGALKCRGEGAGGLLTLPSAVPVSAVAVVPLAAPAFARPPSADPVSRPAVPPVPPPRLG